MRASKRRSDDEQVNPDRSQPSPPSDIRSVRWVPVLNSELDNGYSVLGKTLTANEASLQILPVRLNIYD